MHCVAGAFLNTEFMAPVLDGFAGGRGQHRTADLIATLLSNRDGKPVTSAAAAMDTLVSQLTQPVRWGPVHRDAARTHSHGDRGVPRGHALAVSPNANFGGSGTRRQVTRRPGRAGKIHKSRTRPEQPHTRQFDLYTTYYEGKHAVPVTQEEIIAGIAEIIEEVTGNGFSSGSGARKRTKTRCA